MAVTPFEVLWIVLHYHTTTTRLLRRVGVIALVDSAPFARYHEVLGLFVGERDQIHGSFGHGYPAAIQILLQSLVELIETTKLEFGH